MKKIYHNKKELIGEIISAKDSVLDVGFWGQGISAASVDWPHRFIRAHAKETYGLDTDFDPAQLNGSLSKYIKGDAENFDFNTAFDVIFAADLTEHLSNPGLFLSSCRRNINPTGRLVLTTPNCFNLFNITEKISKGEPTVNHDHTCYFNQKTLATLLNKNGWRVEEISFLYTLGHLHKESLKKKILNILYRYISYFTSSYLETLVVVAVPKNEAR